MQSSEFGPLIIHRIEVWTRDLQFAGRGEGNCGRAYVDTRDRALGQLGKDRKVPVQSPVSIIQRRVGEDETARYRIQILPPVAAQPMPSALLDTCYTFALGHSCRPYLPLVVALLCVNFLFGAYCFVGGSNIRDEIRDYSSSD